MIVYKQPWPSRGAAARQMDFGQRWPVGGAAASLGPVSLGIETAPLRYAKALMVG